MSLWRFRNITAWKIQRDYIARERKEQTERARHTDELLATTQEIAADALVQEPIHDRRRHANSYSQIIFGGVKKGKSP